MKFFKSMSVVALLLVFLMPHIVMATEFNFSVETVQPKSQVDKQKSYFDIKVTPNTSQELTIQLRNDTNKEVVINPQISSATTNLNGVVEYSPNGISRDSSLTYDLAKLVETEKEIRIPEKGSYHLKLKVKAPKEAFDGIIAGGITLKENKKAKDNAKKAPKKEGGLAIENEFSYVVAIILHSRNTEKAPNLNLTKSFPDQVNARNVIMNNLQNDQPVYLNHLKIKAIIRKKGSDKTLYEFSKEDSMQVAPNSNFNFPVPLNGEKLDPGKYEVDLVAFGEEDPKGKYETTSSKEGNKQKYRYKWQMASEFEITKETAKKLNDRDVTIKRDHTLWYLVIGFALIIMALLLIIFFMKKKQASSVKKDDI